jgi:hypothetical protein
MIKPQKIHSGNVSKQYVSFSKAPNPSPHFRTSTVEYVNFLVDKHKLKMPKWKAYNVVLPGGLKFMALLLQLINLVTKEVIQRKEDSMAAASEVMANPAKKFTKDDLQVALEQHKFWCETGVKMKE